MAQAKRSVRTRRGASARKRPPPPQFTAKTADKHVLYQLSVQDAAVEVDFIVKAYQRVHRRAPRTLREDFCGTSLICCHWVKSDPARSATGVDIDPKVLAWGRKHNVAPLGDAAERITLLQADVRAKSARKFDAICAFNFSYWIFTTRDAMRDYFQRVRAGLAPGGIFCLDSYGGWESVEPMYERRSIKRKFTYVWDQDSFDPITHRVVNYIHFEFKDGTKLEKAFRYDWRFWSLPELRELLEEAGFSRVDVYWDRSESEDEEDYRPTTRASNHPGWLAYLVAVR
ncbi:MAG: class I SAM-dependent methyltransferase [Polyangiaceae bacterium]|nr:class I SAM-dependent methyltransferase [Polyangiaceae bacterium]